MKKDRFLIGILAGIGVLAVLAIVLLGVPVYFLWGHRSRPANPIEIVREDQNLRPMR